MLPLFALALVPKIAQDELPPVRSLVDIRRIMASVGYPIKTYLPSSQGERIERGGVSVRFTASPRRDGFGLHAILKTPQPIEQSSLDAWVAKETPRPRFRVKAFEEKTLLVNDGASWNKIANQAELRTLIDGFFVRVDALARLYDGKIGPKVDDGVPPLADDAVLDKANLRTLERSFAAWGWTADSRLHYATTGMVLALVVGSTEMWARNMLVDGKPSFTAFELVIHEGSRGFMAPLDSRDFRKIEKESLNLKNHPDDTYYDTGWHKVKARTTIDLAAGLTISEIRRRVEAFAKAN